MSGQEPIGQLFVRAGCAVCHRIPGIEGAEGRVGPKLVLRTSGPKRLADPRYRGQAKTVREYVIESILNPGIYVVPGYQDKVMPRWYGRKLSAAALEKSWPTSSPSVRINTLPTMAGALVLRARSP